jgi:hypothetical protein
MPSKSESNSKAVVRKHPNDELIPQKHGGALLRGGKKGNKGGGRRPNKIREELRNVLDERVMKEVKRRLGPKNIQKMPDEMLVKYLRELGLLGLGTKMEHSGPDDGPLSHGVLLIPGQPIPGQEDDDEETPS